MLNMWEKVGAARGARRIDQVSETEVPPGTRYNKRTVKGGVVCKPEGRPTNSAGSGGCFALGAPLTSSSVIEIESRMSLELEHPGPAKSLKALHNLPTTQFGSEM